MKLECSVEEFEQLINNFQIKEENIKKEKIYIDGEKLSEQIAPSISKTIRNVGV